MYLILFLLHLNIHEKNQKTKQTIIDQYTNDFDIIYATALLLFESIYNGENLRLVGVSLNNVVHVQDLNIQLSLFGKQGNHLSHHSQTDQFIHQFNEHFLI